MPPRPNERFNDPDGARFGIPTWPWRCAPDPSVLATVRQLKAQGLRPGGQDPAGQLGWSRQGEDMFCPLYRVDRAKPRRQVTAAMREAIEKALRARRICPECKTEKSYQIPRRFGACNDCCADGGYAVAA